MPCFYPIPAWQPEPGKQLSLKPIQGIPAIRIPCGKCLGCRKTQRFGWALRCQLEAQNHETSIFTTLTYHQKYLPPTLDKAGLSATIKRLRSYADRSFRFFASGEYGTNFNRPHYHAIFFGLNTAHAPLIEKAWAKGYTRTYNCTPATIAYVAGYVNKKINFPAWKKQQVSPDGELYTFQPEFFLMSRGGQNGKGIGSFHRDNYPLSWRHVAIYQGNKRPVPRYLHEAWTAQATVQEQELLALERQTEALNRDTSITALVAKEINAHAQLQRSYESRTYG